jgi:hypothetical protein
MARRRTTHCGTCGELKVRREKYSRCLSCRRESDRRYYQRSADRREKLRRARILRHYGIAFEELTGLLERQSYQCAICERRWEQCVPAKSVRHEPSFWNHLCVDHDHETGRIRGLLCNACNTGLGAFEEKPERFVAAVRYLERAIERTTTITSAITALESQPSQIS